MADAATPLDSTSADPGACTNAALVAPENEAAYKSAMKATLTSTSSLTKDLLKQLSSVEEAFSKRNTNHSLVSQGSHRLQRGMALRLGISTTHRTLASLGPQDHRDHDDILDKTWGRLHSLEDVVTQATNAKLACEHSMKDKWGAIKVNEWRLNLRSKRPPKELYKDILQQALEHEQHILAKAFEDLGNAAAKMMQWQGALEEAVGKVGRSLDNLKSRDDLNGTVTPAGVPLELPPLPNRRGVKAAAATSSAEGDAAADSEPVSPTSAATTEPLSPLSPVPPSGPEAPAAAAPTETQPQFLARVVKFQAKAKRAIKDAEAVLEKAGKLCNEASDKVTNAMKKREAELASLKREIEGQLEETSSAIYMAEKAVLRAKARTNQPDGANFETQAATAESVLDRLVSSKKALEEDLRCKMASQKVDMQCKRIPAHLAPSHKNPVARDFNRLLRSMSDPSIHAKIGSADTREDAALTSPVTRARLRKSKTMAMSNAPSNAEAPPSADPPSPPAP